MLRRKDAPGRWIRGGGEQEVLEWTLFKWSLSLDRWARSESLVWIHMWPLSSLSANNTNNQPNTVINYRHGRMWFTLRPFRHKSWTWRDCAVLPANASFWRLKTSKGRVRLDFCWEKVGFIRFNLNRVAWLLYACYFYDHATAGSLVVWPAHITSQHTDRQTGNARLSLSLSLLFCGGDGTNPATFCSNWLLNGHCISELCVQCTDQQ